MSTTLISLFEHQSRNNQRPALRTKKNGIWQTTTFAQWRTESRALASALIEIGIAAGDRVAIFGTTRAEWVTADAAILYAGAVTVPIYPSLIGEQAAYVADDAEARVLFAEDASYVARIEAASPDTISRFSRIVLFDGDASALSRNTAEKCVFWRDVIRHSENRTEIDHRVAATEPSHLATIVYTSGTTGPPKGAMLTHDNFAFETASLLRVLDLSHEDETVLFLPMAHIFAKILVAMQIRVGFTIAFAESIAKTMDNVAEINPTFLGSVPRIYEKIHAVANDRVAAAGGTKKKLFDWAIAVGKEAARMRAARSPMSLVFSAEHALAKKLVLDKIRARFGSKIRFAISGGAPLAEELCVWFHAAGIEILEGYGLTETTAATHITRNGAMRFGTVGKVLPGVEARIAADGEVLMRGRNIMKGYFKKPEATAEAIDSDGYFHSGDIGVVDADGYLKITDRKKDLIVTSGGKNVAPQNIENLLKQSRWVSQAVVIGDNKPYLIALLTLDADSVSGFAKDREKKLDFASLTKDDDLRNLVFADVEATNKHLSSFETVKKIAILPTDFSIETGELTPTLKVKRKVVTERYKTQIEALYASP